MMTTVEFEWYLQSKKYASCFFFQDKLEEFKSKNVEFGINLHSIFKRPPWPTPFAQRPFITPILFSLLTKKTGVLNSFKIYFRKYVVF